MGLSVDLISQFAKIASPKKEKIKEAKVYGTIVIDENDNNSKWIQIDGSDILTPFKMQTIALHNGDRVTASIKNHSLTISGNLSKNSVSEIDVENSIDTIVTGTLITNLLFADEAFIGTLTANEAFIENLTASNAFIDNLIANDAFIDNLIANEAFIENLSAEYAEIDFANITNAAITNLTASQAFISTLNANYASIDFANIDAANISVAKIGDLYARSGMISDLIVQDGHVTGKMQFVELNADLITAGTLAVDHLRLLGTDGLYYAINVEQVGVEQATIYANDPIQKYQIHGSALIAKSVTADQIYVSDLYAFGATIGGTVITDSNMHTTTKTNKDSPSPGFFLNAAGEFSIGDNSQYLKFVKDSSNNFNLDIKASSITLGATNPINLKTKIDSLDGDIENVYSNIDLLEFGGTNLLRNSKNLPIDYTSSTTQKEITSLGYWSISATTGGISIEKRSVDDFYAGIINVSGASSDQYRAVRSPLTPLGDDWNERYITISAYVRSNFASGGWSGIDQNVRIGLNLTNGDSSRLYYKAVNIISVDGSSVSWGPNIIAESARPLNDKWQKIYTVIQLKESDFTKDSSEVTTPFTSCSTFYVNFYIVRNGNFRFYSPKAEYGTKATEWNPSPIDDEDSINDLSGKVKTATDDISDIKNNILPNYATIDILNDKIRSLVVDNNGETMMEQDGDSFAFNFGAYKTDIDNLKEKTVSSDDFDNFKENEIEKIKENVNNALEYKSYIKFSSSSSTPKITLGSTESNFKVEITNERINFKNGSKTPAYIDSTALNISTANIKQELQQGKFAWSIRKNGNYCLTWKG